MSIAVVCPGCSAKLNAPDTAAGKKVKCPKCQGAITIPAPQSDFEVVEDEPVAPVKKSAPKPATKPPVKAAVEADDDEDGVFEKPKKKPARAASDDSDEKPKKKNKKKAAAEGGSSLARNLIGGVVLLILLGVVGFVFYDKFGKKKDEVAETPKDNDPPVVRPGPNPNQGPKPKDQNQVPKPSDKGKPPEKSEEAPTPATDLPALAAQRSIPLSGITCAAVASDGTTVAGTISQFVDLLSLKNVGVNAESFQDHASIVHTVAIAPDGTFLASAGRGDKVVKVRDAKTKLVIGTINLVVSERPTLAFSSDSKTLLVAGSDEKDVKLWDVATRKVGATIAQARVASAAFSSDGKYLVTGYDSTQVWDLENPKEPVATFSGHKGMIEAIVITPDGKTVITGSADGMIKIWDVPTKMVRKTINGHGSRSVTSLALSPDGRFVVSGGYSSSAGVWEVATGRGVAAAHVGEFVYSVAITDYGKTLVTASGSNEVRPKPGDWKGGLKLWDLSSVAVDK